MSHIVSLVDALKPRAAMILEAIADRSTTSSNPFVGHFAGYKASEGLVGELSHLGGDPSGTLFATYKRPRDVDSPSQPAIRFYGFSMTDITEEDRTDATVIQSGIEERHLYHVDLPVKIHDTKTIEHEFIKTISFSEAAKRAWEVAAKASLSLEFSAVKASLEISGKYGEEYTTSSSESETERDKISETFEYTGPIKFDIVAYRSRNRERLLVTAKCDFDFKIAIDPGGDFQGIIYWESFRTSFLPVLRRTAANDEHYYHEFMNDPMSDEDIERIEQASDKLIQFPVEYDDIVTDSLEPLHSDVRKK